eukprot:6189350-Pleurochrysis_carterae.AAC.1
MTYLHERAHWICNGEQRILFSCENRNGFMASAYRKKQLRFSLCVYTLSCAGGPHGVLCLDEVELGDIADAAIVSRLFDSALCSGARIVATSNSAPADLYPGGLNRHVYVPALCKTLERHAVAIHALPPNSKDYRSRPRLKGGSGNKESGGSLNSGFVGRNSSIVHGGGSAVKCNDGGAEGSGGESWGGPAEVAAGGVSDS